MMKPYYNPETKETYIKSAFDGITVRFVTGSVELVPCGDRLNSYRVERNQFGQITKKEKFNSHIVCCGVDYCYTCGKKLT
ncbi:hypothetical protein [Caudoviricetes sp.]|nr:hypothetical protein [Caudoviricetes sp.]